MNVQRIGLSSLIFSIGIAAGQNVWAANVISGKLWHVPDAVAQVATPSSVPSRTPDVTFDVNSPLNFNSPGSVASFLGSGGAFDIVENSSGTLASLMSNAVTSTLITFSGLVSVTTGQMFTVAHDDGLTLIIGGIDLGFSDGPTAPTTSVATYSGPTGTLPFQLVYGECCSGSAVLQVDLPFSNAVSAVPEPNTALLLMFGGAALGSVGRHSMRRRRRSTASSSSHRADDVPSD